MNFEDALRRYWDDFVRYSRALAGSRDNGDDLLQESLVRAWRGYEKLDNNDSFKQWVIRIISNTHKSQIRLGWVKRLVGIDSLEAEPAPVELPYEEKELVRIAFRNLPLKQREALILFEVLSMSVTEIAEIQKVTLSAVKSRLARGREKLQNSYFELNQDQGFSKSRSNNSILVTAQLSVANAVDPTLNSTGSKRNSQ